MQKLTLTLENVFCKDKAGLMLHLAPYLDKESKDQLRQTSTTLKEYIDSTIQKVNIIEWNEAAYRKINSITRSLQLHSIEVKHNPNTTLLFPNIPNLKEFTLLPLFPGNTMTTAQIKSAITNTQQLQKLDLYLDSTNQNIIRAINNIPNFLNCLKELYLHSATIPAHEFNSLFQRTLQLETLKITNCDNIAEGTTQAITAHPNVFKKLKNLDLSSILNITTNEISTIFQHIPQLETLKVFNTENTLQGIVEAISINPNVLQNSKKLILCWIPIETNKLSAILQHVLQLETLNIINCYSNNIPEQIIQAITANSNVLQNLKELVLSGTNIETNELCTILQRALQLEVLKVNNFQAFNNIIQAITTNPNILQNLKKIYLSSSTGITANQLNAILQRAVQLETLSVYNCPNAPEGIVQAITINPNVLQNLKELDISEINITTNQSNAILQNLPQLKELTAHHTSQNFVEAIITNYNMLQGLKKLDISGTYITQNQLNQLQQLLPLVEIIL